MKVSCIMPQELLNLVAEKCQDKGITRTEFIIEAIWFYLLNSRENSN